MWHQTLSVAKCISAFAINVLRICQQPTIVVRPCSNTGFASADPLGSASAPYRICQCLPPELLFPDWICPRLPSRFARAPALLTGYARAYPSRWPDILLLGYARAPHRGSASAPIWICQRYPSEQQALLMDMPQLPIRTASAPFTNLGFTNHPLVS